ncbi:MAG: DUF1801 domain-containing protein [Lacibacter sp.]
MNHSVDNYLINGCERCPLGGTAQCKVNNWQKELKKLRAIVLDCGLTETAKWGVPCYTFQNKNIVIVSAFKEYCAISFFKGALLSDTDNLLSKPGENTQSGRLIRFTGTGQIAELEATLKAYIFEAIEVEKAGVKINFATNSDLNPPSELQKKMDENPALRTAFYLLTPGRQRGYILFFSAPKQSKTREQRIEKYLQRILNGKGLNDY